MKRNYEKRCFGSPAGALFTIKARTSEAMFVRALKCDVNKKEGAVISVRCVICCLKQDKFQVMS